ncbi:hypothetical protein EDC14_102248 [Hydrogenispora ethanolica]|jgi:hypothetical protein|uniref:Uncharacterized protein n=1 Tax=Hydrogenispora ethanolica TaxID=1082276 RepID=A0A4R1RB44_HYDET|nr:hypothetical protein [Hydrogenispora ethanolica]TCL62994.1 hypothetical protein EDC14_102248 [Hydrogenispora ethanolica]
MREFLKRYFKIELSRDNNYYFGLSLLIVGIVSIFWYLKFDLFEPLAFLVTFLIIGWGFVLLWKSDDDLRFEQAQAKIAALETELESYRMASANTLSLPNVQPSQYLRKYRSHRRHCF